MMKKILAILTALTLLSGCSVSANPYDEQINLGYKLLELGQYEEAILAFDKAIKIDIKRDVAYIGKAEIYVARLDENTVADAGAALKLGYEQSGSASIISAYISLADKLIVADKSDWAIQLLELGHEVTKNEGIKIEIDKLSSQVLGRLVADEGDMKNLKELLDKCYDIVGSEFDCEKDDALRYVLDSLWSGYEYYFGDSERESTDDVLYKFYTFDASAVRSPAKNVDWILENIFNTKPTHSINSEYVYYYDDYYYTPPIQAGYT